MHEVEYIVELRHEAECRASNVGEHSPFPSLQHELNQSHYSSRVNVRDVPNMCSTFCCLQIRTAIPVAACRDGQTFVGEAGRQLHRGAREGPTQKSRCLKGLNSPSGAGWSVCRVSYRGDEETAMRQPRAWRSGAKASHISRSSLCSSLCLWADSGCQTMPNIL